MVGKCPKCEDLGHRSNKCRACKTINIADHKDDFEEEGDAQDDRLMILIILK